RKPHPLTAALGALTLLCTLWCWGPSVAEANESDAGSAEETPSTEVQAPGVPATHGPARGDVCDEIGYGMPQGPVTAGLLDGDLGRARRVCSRSEAGLSGSGLLVVDTMAFYGHLLAGLTLDGSLPIGAKLEIFGSIEALRYQQVITPIPSSYLGIGHTALGASYRFMARPKWSLAVHGKVVLPTAIGLYRNAWPLASDLAVAALFQLRRGIRVHASAGMANSIALSKGPAFPTIGAMVTAGIELQPVHGFAFVADVHGGFGRRAPVDVIAAAMALRFSDGKRFGFEVGATVPLAGRERAAATLDLRASLRIGRKIPAAGTAEEEQSESANSP
ncbi:MAG: hypothetical protein CL928_06475, partial [Deltaproteobacteria bacterium]|nr:hypothetical protein [Deltaproteobacteria bacterium]